MLLDLKYHHASLFNKKDIIALRRVKFLLWCSLASSHTISEKISFHMFFIFGLIFMLVAHMSKLHSGDISYHILVMPFKH